MYSVVKVVSSLTIKRILINKHNGMLIPKFASIFLAFYGLGMFITLSKSAPTGLYCEVRKPSQHRQTFFNPLAPEFSFKFWHTPYLKCEY